MTDETPKHPGRILFEQVMTPLGVSRNKLARDIDVPVGRISDIVAGKRGVTPDTALRFAKYFGTTPELWLRLQADYDLHVARTTTWPKAETKVAVLEPTPSPAPSSASSPAPSPVPPPAAPAESPPAAPEPPDAGPPDADAPAEEVPPATVPTGGSPGDDDPDLDPDLDDDEDIDIPEPIPGSGRS